MPRTMAVIGFTFFFSLWFFLETSQTVALVTAVVAIVGFAVSMIISSLRREAVFPSVFLTVLAACILFNVQIHLVYKPALSLAGEKVSVVGEICELPYKNSFGRYCYVLNTYAVDGVPYDTKIRFTSDEKLEAEPCDILSFVGEVYVRGTDETEIRENLMSDGVWLGAYSNDRVTVVKGEKSLNYYLLKIRQFTEETILKSLPQREASVLVALLLGNTSYMADDAYDDSLRSGILHIFAVSGFNLSLFSMSMFMFLKKKKAPRMLSSLLPMLVVLFLMAVTGFSQSCVRAGIMILTLLAGNMFSQRADSLNSLGLASLIICFVNPFQASSAGFHLSLFASGTIILVSPIINEKIVKRVDFKFRPINTVMRYILSTFLTSVCVCVALLPVMLHHFDGVSLVAPIANCFTVFASEWEMVLGFIGVVFSTTRFFTFITKPIFLIAGILSDYIVSTADFFSEFTLAYVNTEYPEIKIWICGVLVSTALILLMKTDVRKRVLYIFTVSLATLTFTVSLLYTTERNTVTFTVLPTGNNPCVTVSCRDKTVFIGDVNSYDCMQSVNDITDGSADVMILPNTDNNAFLTDLLSSFEFGEIVIPKKNADVLSLSYYTTPTVAKSYSLTVSENLTMEYDFDDTGSAVYIQANGKSILMILRPGRDLSSLPTKWLSADILYGVSDVPNGLESEKYGHVILSTDTKRGEKLSKLIGAAGANVTFTGNDKVTLIIDDNGLSKIQIQ